jgi:hypothetical protein
MEQGNLETDNSPLPFSASYLGVCDSCAENEVPVMAFRDEYGVACCERCYVEGMAAMEALSPEERAELERISEIANAHHAV